MLAVFFMFENNLLCPCHKVLVKLFSNWSDIMPII